MTPALTKLAEEGKTGGYFFRTIPVARSTALVHAQTAMDKGYKKTVIMYINNDFGNGVAPDAKKALEKLGGTVVGLVPYAENQSTYRSDVQKALALNPDSLILVGLSADGTVVPKPVRTGDVYQGLRIVQSGLTPDDHVIIDGLMRARPGAKVAPVDGSIAPAASTH